LVETINGYPLVIIIIIIISCDTRWVPVGYSVDMIYTGREWRLWSDSPFRSAVQCREGRREGRKEGRKREDA
jgi:hypothetical protein